jgi:hypothetical protein
LGTARQASAHGASCAVVPMSSHRQPNRAMVRPSFMGLRAMASSSLVLLLGAGVGGCSTDSATDAEASTAPASPSALSTVAASPPANADVTARARAALTEVGVSQLVTTPGYDREVNTALEGAWRAHPLVAYVVPSGLADANGGELTVVSSRTIHGEPVEMVRGQDSSTTMVRFALGPDTWLVASLSPEGSPPTSQRTIALARALLSHA